MLKETLLLIHPYLAQQLDLHLLQPQEQFQC